MTLHTDFDKEVEIEGNLSLIGSIFRNLTENAMAYSGGKNIYISLMEDNDSWCSIRFEDDGCGVEEKQLSRLFERFYRVDKGRSRQLGGTGLGLSIVKHAVLFHGGTITASNRPGGGLRFEFSLKKERECGRINTECHSDDRREEESRVHQHVHFPLCSRDSSLRSE